MKCTNRTTVKLIGLVAVATNLLTCATNAQTFTTLKSFGSLTNVSGYHPQYQLVQGADGALYGTAYDGEGAVRGTVFKLQPDGSGFTTLKWFTNSVEGKNPNAGLKLSGNVLYGTTSEGGTGLNGVVFKLNTDGTGFSVLKDFSHPGNYLGRETNSDGALPSGGLTLSGGVLYGTTYQGGNAGYGTVFKMNIDGTGFTVLRNFSGRGAPDPDTGTYTNSDGAYPYAALTLSGGTLYGTTSEGGDFNVGTVFKMNTDGTGFAVLRNFIPNVTSEGYNPRTALTLSGSTLYGTARDGGLGWGLLFQMNTDGTGYTALRQFANGYEYNPSDLILSGGVLYGTAGNPGRVFKVNIDGSGYTALKDFTEGGSLFAGLALSGNVLYGTTSYGGYLQLGSVFKMNTDGTSYTVIKEFTPSDGVFSYARLAISGNLLYGTTHSGGSSNWGTVFQVATDGTGYAILKHFAGGDGANPHAGLTLSGSVLYGTTESGGSSNYGTVFKLNTNGTGYTVLKHFTGNDGANPQAVLTLSGSTLYGTTYSGGTSNGTVFKVNTDGTGFTVLKNFDATNGANPCAGLTLSGSTLYGTASSGGSLAWGTVFKMNVNGTGYTVLKNFNYTGGAVPKSGLTLSGSVLYGTTAQGGSGVNDIGTVFKMNTDGTGYTVLKTFPPVYHPITDTYTYPDGYYPDTALTLSGSTLYGTTAGGFYSLGTVFKVKTDGTGFTMLKEFLYYNNEPQNPVRDGRQPRELTLSGSVLYGTTYDDGNPDSGPGAGTVFKLDLSIPLTVQLLSGAVVLTWTDQSFALQAAPIVTGIYTNIPGALSPYTNLIAGPQKFFRLKMD